MNRAADDQFREAVRHYNAGDRAVADRICREILAGIPGHADATRMLARLLEQSGQLTESAALLRESVARHPSDFRLLFPLGRVLARNGQFTDAVEVLERAHGIDPEDTQVLLSLGYCHLRRGEPDAALGYYERALERTPDDPSIHRGRGEILTRLTRFDEAIEAYRSALSVDSRDAVACARLAELYERTNRLADMEDAVRRGLQLQPDDPELGYHQAVLLRRRGKLEEARALLDGLGAGELSSGLRRRMEFEAARVLDRLGRYPEAFARASEGNRVAREQATLAGHELGAYTRWLDRIQAEYSSAWASGGPRVGGTAGADIVFIFGFPRSGTTLIDTILGIRDEFQVYEEKGFLGALFDILDRRGLSYPECGASLDEDVTSDLRDGYYEAVQRSAERVPGTRIVDKDPLLTPAVPLLQQVFPAAKYLYAVRHPLDVCLSCFMYDFSPNAALADYATVEELADVYARVVRNWRLVRRHLPLEVMELRYESLVRDFEAQTRNLFDFLGVPWDQSVLEFGRHARELGQPRLRNYDRVTEGLYTGSLQRWKNYEEQLESAIPVVKDAMTYFDYDS